MTDRAEDPRRPAARGQLATVLGRLNNGMLRLRTNDGSEVTGHAALDLRMALTRLLPGDAVRIEVSPFDRSRARILGLDRSQDPARRHEVTDHRQPQLEQSPQQRELP